jgi:hypothetical protein
MSQGAYGLSDAWVMIGLSIFVVVVLLGEGVLWPAERRIQVGLSSLEEDGVADAVAHDAQLIVRSATVALVLLIAGTVIMVAQP